VPFPAVAIRAYLLTGTFDPTLWQQSLEIYPVALLFGGLGAAAVGLLYGLFLVSVDRFRPALLHATKKMTRVAKSIVFPLIFTASLGSAGSLITLRARHAAFQILGDPTSFAAPTLLCAFLFTLWVFPRLPGQIGLLARRTDGEVREP